MTGNRDFVFHSFVDIIEAWPNDPPDRPRPGPLPRFRLFADDLDIPYKTALAWRSRDNIPARYWRRMVNVAKRRKVKGVTFECLAMIAGREVG